MTQSKSGPTTTTTAAPPLRGTDAGGRAVPAPVAGARRRKLWVGTAVAGLVLAGAVATFLLLRHPKIPTGNDLVAASKYVASADFLRLPPDQRMSQAANLREKADEIQALYKDGKLSDAEYRAAMNVAWIGKQEEHVARYFALPEGKPRRDYLDHLTKKYAQKKARSKAAGEENFKHDAAFEERYIADWPADKRRKYEEFRTAYADRRKESEAPRAATRPGSKATRPAAAGPPAPPAD